MAFANGFDVLGHGFEYLLGKNDVRVVTVTDTTSEGTLAQPATPAAPVYYIAFDAGYGDYGGSIAGEHPPARREILNTIVPVLAKQGYLLATKAHPPTIALFWTWGTMNVDIRGDERGNDTQINHGQMLRFMGAYKLGLVTKEPSIAEQDLAVGLLLQDATTESIERAARDHLDIVAIFAYDYQSFRQKEKKLLWTTKISCPSPGLQMTVTIPSMLAIAGPYIGRETPTPVLVKATDRFKPEVKIGELTTMKADSTSIIEATADDLRSIFEARHLSAK